MGPLEPVLPEAFLVSLSLGLDVGGLVRPESGAGGISSLEFCWSGVSLMGVNCLKIPVL